MREGGMHARGESLDEGSFYAMAKKKGKKCK
jgi:hypothetical protein